MTKAERREAMPQCTRFIDDMRAAFGEPAYIKAQENGCNIEWGEKIEGQAVRPILARKKK